jgi:Leucine-rich repeat (LRR) protein
MRVTNGIPLGRPLLLPVGTVNCVQTLKASTLKELLLGSNRLTTVDDCACLPSGLQILDIRDNKVRELGVGIAKLVALERLDVSNNDLSSLPAELGRCKTIKYDALPYLPTPHPLSNQCLPSWIGASRSSTML